MVIFLFFPGFSCFEMGPPLDETDYYWSLPLYWLSLSFNHSLSATTHWFTNSLTRLLLSRVTSALCLCDLVTNDRLRTEPRNITSQHPAGYVFIRILYIIPVTDRSELGILDFGATFFYLSIWGVYFSIFVIFAQRLVYGTWFFSRFLSELCLAYD
jgi:hypothetical protein